MNRSERKESEFAARRRQVSDLLPECGIDAALVSSAHNLRYLTGFTGSNGLLLLAGGQAVFYTDPRYGIQAAQETGLKPRVEKGSLWLAAAKRLVRNRLRTIGLEENAITCALRRLLETGLGRNADFQAIDCLLNRLRMRKSPAELDLIRHSVEVNSKAYEAAIKRVKPEMTERDLAAEIDYQMRREGADGTAFETIVASGKRASLPHARPTSQRIGTGEMVLVDMGACCDGYMSDMTRMFHLGRCGRKFRSLYKAVLEAQMAAVDAVCPGVLAATVDQVARRVLRRYGIEKAFVHSLGHGLGLEIHEAPRLAKTDKTVLEAGMVVTIEPGVYFGEFGGIRIEDTVLVTEDGCQVLTPTPKDLLVL